MDLNNDLRIRIKIFFQKGFFKLMNNAVFGKAIKNLRKHGDIKLFTTERRINQFMSEPDFQTTKFFTENLLAIGMEKIEILMNKPVYLEPSKLELSNILMYEFWYDYTKPKYGENAKVCYMDTESFIIYVKTDDIYKDIAEDVETRFHTSNFELDRLLPKGKNEKVIGLMKVNQVEKSKQNLLG